MGYETKLLIGQISQSVKTGDRCYFSQIASIDLCKTDIFKDTRIELEKPLEDFTHVYIYDSSGNKEITEDFYGSPLVANDPKKVLELMKKSHKKEYYRRYAAAIPLLQSIIDDFTELELACVLYGH